MQTSYKAVLIFTIVVLPFTVLSTQEGYTAEKDSIDITAVRVPEIFGIVKEVHKGTNDKTVFHIQDAHCNFEAQDNNSKILRNFVDNYGIDVVAVEGSSGVIDTAPFSGYPNKKARDDVAFYFMQHGKITGPEYLAITGDRKFTLFGIEDKALYKENYDLFLKSLKFKAEAASRIDELKGIYVSLMNNMYGPELKGFNAKVLEYKDGKIKFTEFAKVLNEYADHMKLDTKKYKNLSLQKETQTIEKQINFDDVEKERGALIDTLSKKLSKDELSDLVTKSLSFRLGRMTSEEYYSHLKDYAKKANISLKDYSNLSKYIEYLNVFAKIDKEKLIDEADQLESAIKDKMFANKTQRELDRLAKDVDILGKLFALKLSIKDYNTFNNNKASFTSKKFLDFARKHAKKYGIFVPKGKNIPIIDNNMDTVDSFYQIATRRDKSLIDNALSVMNKRGQNKIVVVTGGFHTEGIRDQLKRDGYSYMIITPRITKFDVSNPYVDVMTGKETPLEAMLTGTVMQTGTLSPETELDKEKFKKVFTAIAKVNETLQKLETGEAAKDELEFKKRLEKNLKVLNPNKDVVVQYSPQFGIYYFMKDRGTDSWGAIYRIALTGQEAVPTALVGNELPGVTEAVGTLAGEGLALPGYTVKVYAPNATTRERLVVELDGEITAATFGELLNEKRREVIEGLKGQFKTISDQDVPNALKGIIDVIGGTFNLTVVPSNHKINTSQLQIGEKEAYGVSIGSNFVITEEALKSTDPKVVAELVKAAKHEMAEMDELRKGASPDQDVNHKKYAHVLGLMAELGDNEALPARYIEYMDNLLSSGNFLLIKQLADNTDAKIEEIEANPYFKKDEKTRFFAVNTARLIKAYLLNYNSTISGQAQMTQSLVDVMKARSTITDQKVLPLANVFHEYAVKLFQKQDISKQKGYTGAVANYFNNNGCDLRVAEASMSEEEKQELIDKTEPLSPRELGKVRNPTAVFNGKDIENLPDIVKRAIILGEMKPIVFINIKELAGGENFLNYYAKAMNYARELNGNVTFIFSVEKPDQWKQDNPGLMNAQYRIVKFFGEDFYLNSDIVGIPDGGNKTRGLTQSVEKAGEWYVTAQMRMLWACFIDMMSRRLRIPNVNDYVSIDAGDNVLITGGDSVGFDDDGQGNMVKRPISEIYPERDNMLLSGKEALILDPKDMDTFADIVDRIIKDKDLSLSAKIKKARPNEARVLRKNFLETNVLNGKDAEGNVDPDEQKFVDKVQAELSHVFERIAKEKIEQLGAFTTNAKGEIKLFLEKERPIAIMAAAYTDGEGRINKNLFVMLLAKKFMLELFKQAEQNPLPNDILPFEGFYSFFKAFSISLLDKKGYSNAIIDRAKEFKVFYTNDIAVKEKAVRDQLAKKDEKTITKVEKEKEVILKKKPELESQPDVLVDQAISALALNQWAKELAKNKNFKDWFKEFKSVAETTRGVSIEGSWLDAGDVTSYYEVVFDAYINHMKYFRGEKDAVAVDTIDDSELITSPEQKNLFLDNVVIKGGIKVKVNNDTILQNCYFEGPIGTSIALPSGIYMNCRIVLGKDRNVNFNDKSGKVFISGMYFDGTHDVYEYGADINNLSEKDIVKTVVIRGDELYRQLAVRNNKGEVVWIETRVPVTHNPKGITIKQNIVNTDRLVGLLNNPIIRDGLVKKSPEQYTIGDLVYDNAKREVEKRAEKRRDIQKANLLVEAFPQIIYKNVVARISPEFKYVLTFDEFINRVSLRATTERSWWRDNVAPVIDDMFNDKEFLKANLADKLIEDYKANHPEMLDSEKNINESWYGNEMIKGYRLEELQKTVANIRNTEQEEKNKQDIQIEMAKRELEKKFRGPGIAEQFKEEVMPNVPEQFNEIFTDQLFDYFPQYTADEIINGDELPVMSFYFSAIVRDKNGNPIEIEDEEFAKIARSKLRVVIEDEAGEITRIQDIGIVKLADRNEMTGQYDMVLNAPGLKRYKVEFSSNRVKNILAYAGHTGKNILKVSPWIMLPGQVEEVWGNFMPITEENPYGDLIVSLTGEQVMTPSGGGMNPEQRRKLLDEGIYNGIKTALVTAIDNFRNNKDHKDQWKNDLRWAMSEVSGNLPATQKMKYLPALVSVLDELARESERGQNYVDSLYNDMLPEYISEEEAKIAQAGVTSGFKAQITEQIDVAKAVLAARAFADSIMGNVDAVDVVDRKVIISTILKDAEVSGVTVKLPPDEGEVIIGKGQPIENFTIEGDLVNKETISKLLMELTARKDIIENDLGLKQIMEMGESPNVDQLNISLDLIAEYDARNNEIRNRGIGFNKILNKLVNMGVHVNIVVDLQNENISKKINEKGELEARTEEEKESIENQIKALVNEILLKSEGIDEAMINKLNKREKGQVEIVLAKDVEKAIAQVEKVKGVEIPKEKNRWLIDAKQTTYIKKLGKEKIPYFVGMPGVSIGDLISFIMTVDNPLDIDEVVLALDELGFTEKQIKEYRKNKVMPPVRQTESMLKYLYNNPRAFEIAA